MRTWWPNVHRRTAAWSGLFRLAMSRPISQSPARRADAEGNRDKILAAASAAFDGSDAQVPMAEISRRAGIGMATLYRNFPSRREPLAAL
jgi:AcrR family transcriptional regulator